MTPELRRQAKDVFLRCRQLGGEERALFLDEACAGDGALRHEVEELLRHSRNADTFLDVPALEMMARRMGDERSLTDGRNGPERQPGGGDRLMVPGAEVGGRYRVVEEIGRGGVGAAFLAQDAKMRGAMSVIKVPLEGAFEGDSAAWLERKFKDEVEALARINHPGVVKAFDAGHLPDGRPYLVLQYVPGRTLRTLIPPRGMEAARAARLLRQMGRALTAAHQHGVVHRDLKPENVVVQSEGGEEYVKLIDFGIASIIDAPETGRQTTPAGTPAYMAPEQAEGRPSARGDIYSLGVIACELLTGRRPGERCGEEGGGGLTGDCLPHNIPEPARAAIVKSLARDPGDRYPRAADFTEALYQALSPNKRTTAGRPVRRRIAAAAGFCLVAAAIGYAGVKVWLRPPGPRPVIKSVAVLPFQTTGGADESWEMGIADSVICRLTQLNRLAVRTTRAVEKYRGTSLDPADVGRELQVDAVLVGRLQPEGGRVRVTVQIVSVGERRNLWAESVEEDRSPVFKVYDAVSLRVAQAIVPKLTGEEEARLNRRETPSGEAYASYQRGRFHWGRRTIDDLNKAVSAYGEALRLDAGFARAYVGLAESYALLSTYGALRPHDAFPKARAAAVEALRLDPTLAEAHSALGAIKAQYEWDLPGAEGEFRSAIGINSHQPTAHQWLAETLVLTGRFDEALAEARLARELDPTSMITNWVVAEIYYYARKYDDAAAELRKLIEMDRHFEMAHFLLGKVYEQQGQYPKAVEALQTVLSLSPKDPDAVATLGHIYASAGNRAKALEALKNLRHLAKNYYVPPYCVATVYSGLRDSRSALDWWRKAIDERYPDMLYIKIDPRFEWLRSKVQIQSLQGQPPLPQ